MTGTSEVVELDLTFRAVDAGASVHHEVPDIFAASWPAYRAWFLREGEQARPSYADRGVRSCASTCPSSSPTYDRLVDAVGGGDLEARFLSHWNPPPLFAACSLAAWDRDRHLLVRNYDYPPLLCDTTVLRDDVERHPGDGDERLRVGRARRRQRARPGRRDRVRRSPGRRRRVRHRAGRPLRPASSPATCREALEVLARIPVQLAYNVALADAQRSRRDRVHRAGPADGGDGGAYRRPTARAPPSGPSTRRSAPPRSARPRSQRCSPTRRRPPRHWSASSS